MSSLKVFHIEVGLDWAMADEICRKYRREGRLFELALKNQYDCPEFIKSFMNSRAAAALDDVHDRLQWAGEEYILEELDVEMAIDNLKEICRQKMQN